MKEQYVGDISDYRKYALLRALAAGGQTRIGVAWMLTPPDGRPDGNKIDYLKQPDRFRVYDPELFDLLASVAGEEGARRLQDIEHSGIIPDAVYFNEYLPDKIEPRRAWFDGMLQTFADRDLIFFDPDNGLDVKSIPNGKAQSSKFLYRDEVAATYARGHSVLIYQHFTREVRGSFIERIGSDVRGLTPGAETWAFRTSHVVFFLAIQSAHIGTLGKAAKEAAGQWDKGFMTGSRI